MGTNQIIWQSYQHKRRKYGNRSDNRRQLSRGKMRNYTEGVLSSMEWERKLMAHSCPKELTGKIPNKLIVIPLAKRAEIRNKREILVVLASSTICNPAFSEIKTLIELHTTLK
jgi:hypothetical protein